MSKPLRIKDHNFLDTVPGVETVHEDGDRTRLHCTYSTYDGAVTALAELCEEIGVAVDDAYIADTYSRPGCDTCDWGAADLVVISVPTQAVRDCVDAM